MPGRRVLATGEQPPPVSHVRFLVIGAGPTGLGAAARLEQRGEDYLVTEAADRLGGAAAAVTDDAGFVWSVVSGTDADWQSLAEQLVDPARLWLESRVVHVDVTRRIAIFADGAAVNYDYCVSSAPLPMALSWAGARDLGVGLRAQRVLVAGLGYRGEEPAGLRELEGPWAKLTPLNGLAPAGHWSVLAEAPLHGRDDVNPASVVRAAHDRLMSLGLVTDAAAAVWAREFSPGHPLPTPGRDELLRGIDERLRAHGFYSRGRLGGWRAESAQLDISYRQGGEAVEAALAGAQEQAYWASHTAEAAVASVSAA